MPGSQLLVLCPRCDADDPAATELLAWFAIYSAVGSFDVAELETIATRWVSAVQARPTGVGDLADDVEAWRRGDYDTDHGDTDPGDVQNGSGP
jgi:hypothetical protein